MAYTHCTLAQARSQLLARLQDASGIFFVAAEANGYLRESLRTWQSLTGYWRARATFDTVAATSFYDLSALLSPALRAPTLLDQDLIADIEYHLMEPATPTVWTGTAQFLLQDLTDSLQRRRNQFLVETGCHLTHNVLAMPAPPIGRVSLSDNVIDVRRAAWYNVNSVYTHLWREDEWAMNASDPTWSTSYATPQSFSIIATPQVSIQVSPNPLDIGTLDLLTINTGAALDPATGILMGIPDDFCWIVKWGALADLLSKDGPAHDTQRADYCEKRYQQGVQLANLFTCVIQAEIAGVPLIVNSLADLDAFDQDWQNGSSTPTDIAIAGLNLIVPYPKPDGIYALTFDVVRNAPVPAADGDYLQVGREELEAILGYAEHLAMFKVGGPEFAGTSHYWDNMLRIATAHSERMSAASRYVAILAEQSRKEEYARPRRVTQERSA